MENEKFQEFVVKHLMNISTDVSTLKSDVSTLKSDVSTLKSDVSTLKSDVSTLKSDVSSLKKTVTRIETRMETEIVDKIKVLFDGHQQHDERLDRIEKKIGINM